MKPSLSRLSQSQLLGRLQEVASQDNSRPSEIIPVVAALSETQRAFPQKPPTAAQWAAFESWLLARGVEPFEGKFRVVPEIGNEGAGLVAVRSIKAGEDVLSVPRSAMITRDVCNLNPLLAQLITNDTLIRQLPQLHLTVFLMVERLKGNESEWAPYIRILPARYCTPLEWSVADFEALGNSPVAATAASLLRQHARWYCYLLGRATGPLGLMNDRDCTWSLFSWAVGAILSRQNALPPDNAPALIPLWDLLNHEPSKITSHYDADGAGSLKFSAPRSFGTGEQLRMHYGSRSNGDLLLNFGFTLAENPNHTVFLHLDQAVAKDDPLRSSKLTLIEKLVQVPPSDCRVGMPAVGSVPSDVKAMLRLLSATDKEQLATATAAVLALQKAMDAERNVPVEEHLARLEKQLADSLSNSDEACQLSLARMVASELALLPGTAEKDVLALRSLPPATPSAVVLGWRIAERRFLERWRAPGSFANGVSAAKRKAKNKKKKPASAVPAAPTAAAAAAASPTEPGAV